MVMRGFQLQHPTSTPVGADTHTSSEDWAVLGSGLTDGLSGSRFRPRKGRELVPYVVGQKGIIYSPPD